MKERYLIDKNIYIFLFISSRRSFLVDAFFFLCLLGFYKAFFKKDLLGKKLATWLILPVVICLSQRLSHACLSISNIYSETANGSLNQLSFIWWYFTTWITVVILELIHAWKSRPLEGMYLLDKKPMSSDSLVIHSNLTNRIALCWRWFIQISALSTFDGRI